MQFLPDDGTLTSRIQDYLKVKLPPYMVPAMYILVNNLPVTPNGKLDRTTLSHIFILYLMIRLNIAFDFV